MAVAKSYQSLKVSGEPYLVGNKMYINVITKSGSEKVVRWYSPNEYQKLYGEVAPEVADEERKTQKEVLGFDQGYITIFKGNTYEAKDWLKEHGARYTRVWGWYFMSTIEVPTDIPYDITPVQLNWDAVGNADETLKSDEEVEMAVAGLTMDPDGSEYVGEVGDRIEVELTVERAIALDGYYGQSIMHIMRDAAGNAYVWTTSAKCWEENSVHMVRGTIKDHKMYKNTKQTILTRCKEIDK